MGRSGIRHVRAVTTVTATAAARVATTAAVTAAVAATAITGPGIAPADASPQQVGSVVRLTAVDALSPTDSWAVGDVRVAGLLSTVIEHWDGTAWSRLPSPNPGGAFGSSLTGVTAVAADDAWAVGSYGAESTGSRTMILHWNGTTWTQALSPNPSATGENRLTAVSALGPDDVWAVGWHTSSQLDEVTLAAHWDGAQWNVTLSPNPSHKVGNVLSGVSGTASDDVWAVGAYAPTTATQATLLARWNGKRWSQLTSPNPGNVRNELLGVTALSATSAWAVGDSARSAGASNALITRWTGRRWVRQPGPDLSGADSGLLSVSADAKDDAWAVGWVQGASGRESLIAHWDGTTWSRVPSPSPGIFDDTLHGVMVGGRDSAWAVGTAATSSEEADPLIAGWDGIQWLRY